MSTGTMPQNKNLTQICLSEGGFGKGNGVTYASKKSACSEMVFDTGHDTI
jgi:hypothetical protein